MKITGVKFIKLTGRMDPRNFDMERGTRSLDLYAEYADIPSRRALDAGGKTGVSGTFMVLETDEGIEGIFGPLVYELEKDIRIMANFITGKDPLMTEIIWDQLHKSDRHARKGMSMMALSAIDCALWDIKGKIFGLPVWRLLGGGGRETMPAYASMLSYSLEPDEAVKVALEKRAEGYAAQKWFFRYGPYHGFQGMKKNLSLAFALREALGEDYDLMFDAWMGWDIAYAKKMCRELEKVNPRWMEEPLMPDDLEGYRELHSYTRVPLSAGEHLYTRWDVKPFLREGVLDVIQADPSWTGGITELKKIGAIVELYGRQLIPHCCHTHAGAHVAMSMSPAVSPWMEYLIPYQERQQFFLKWPTKPVGGKLVIPEVPGLALELDVEQAESVEEYR